MTIYIHEGVKRTLREARKAVAWGRQERVEVVVCAPGLLRTLKRVTYFREGRLIRKEVR